MNYTSLENEIPTAEQPHDTTPKKKRKTLWIIIGLSVFLIVAIIIILIVSCSNKVDRSSPQAAITSLFNSFQEDDGDALADVLYPTISSRGKLFGLNNDEYLIMLENALLEYKTYSKFYDVKITDNQQLSDDELSSYIDSISDDIGYIDITTMSRVSGTINADSENDSCILSFEILVACCGNEYYIYSMSIDE